MIYNKFSHLSSLNIPNGNYIMNQDSQQENDLFILGFNDIKKNELCILCILSK